ncbi:MAG: DNA-3-methyladenine glycosylase [Gammaproteobacteria bacterium]
MSIVPTSFFSRDSCAVACDLLGKIIRHNYRGKWLAAQIIETEAYYLTDKGSHASLGYTQKRAALFMPAGTIYMYYARGRDSINVSCEGEGNAVLIKSAYPYEDKQTDPQALELMQASYATPRPVARLCAGQTLLCQALYLKLPQWNQQQFHPEHLFIDDVGYHPDKIVQTRRLGIPIGRDEHLPYRFIDLDFVEFCTSNPLRKRGLQEGSDYLIMSRNH